MRAARAVLATVALLWAPTLVHAQTPSSAPALPPVQSTVQILPATRLAALTDSLPPGAIRSVQIARFPGLANALNTRDTSGVHERHEDFTDIFVIQRGTAHLLYGGTADGERSTSPGEWRGGTIRGGTSSEVHPGDIVVIPAGVPHQFVLAPGERIAYLSFKVARKGAE